MELKSINFKILLSLSFLLTLETVWLTQITQAKPEAQNAPKFDSTYHAEFFEKLISPSETNRFFYENPQSYFQGSIISSERVRESEKKGDSSSIEFNPPGTEKGCKLPKSFIHNDQVLKTSAFLEKSRTSSVLMSERLQDTFGLVLEHYSPGVDRESKHFVWSVTKSVVSMLVGMAVYEKRLDIDSTVASVLPDFIDSVYGNSTFRELLLMRSLAKQQTDGPHSDTKKMMDALTLKAGTFTDMAKEMSPGFSGFGKFEYNGSDTHVLSLALEKIYKKPLNQIFEEELWIPLGMAQDGFLITDLEAGAFAAGGLIATSRDLIKLGQLMLTKGKIGNNRLFSEEWWQQSTLQNQQAMYFADGYPGYSYGFQWWIPRDFPDVIMAIGLFNQYLYIDTAHEVVIVKTSDDPEFLTEELPSRTKHLNFFKATIKQCGL